MGGFPSRSAIALGAAAIAASGVSAMNVQPIDEGPQLVGDGRYSRNRGRKQAKPKKRPNRLTISKRVRRKHRRARS